MMTPAELDALVARLRKPDCENNHDRLKLEASAAIESLRADKADLHRLWSESVANHCVTTAALAEAQAKIDRLMHEYCPDEMTPEQMANWWLAQKAAPYMQQAAAAIEELRQERDQYSEEADVNAENGMNRSAYWKHRAERAEAELAEVKSSQAADWARQGRLAGYLDDEEAKRKQAEAERDAAIVERHEWEKARQDKDEALELWRKAKAERDAAIKDADRREMEGYRNGLIYAGNLKARTPRNACCSNCINDIREQIDAAIDAALAQKAAP